MEHVCRITRNSTKYFGGLQVVCAGDFYQLPPIANDLYQDPGTAAFMSPVWQHSIPHKVILSEVLRQNDKTLTTAINELEQGYPSTRTNELMHSLSRPLSSSLKPIVLYANNIDVDWHNTSSLSKLPGPVSTYISNDQGDINQLNKMTVQKTLSLKVDCPVILLKNISSDLVNGLQGTVTKLEIDGPTVFFNSKNITVKLQKYLFTTHDPKLNIDTASRLQYPIKPAFAITIHKSQGMTFPVVEVNCKNIIQPGQLGVAVGRAVSLEGLCVKNYHQNICRPHPPEIEKFSSEPGKKIEMNRKCCYEVHF